jgi:hypothetical protein
MSGHIENLQEILNHLKDSPYDVEHMENSVITSIDYIKEIEEKIENAGQAMAETSRSWEHRCFSIMNALGMDFGEPTPDIPEQDGWYAMNLKRTEEDAFNARQEAFEIKQKYKELLEVLKQVDDYLTKLQTPGSEPLNSVNACSLKKERSYWTSQVRNEAREMWALLGNTINELENNGVE